MDAGIVTGIVTVVVAVVGAPHVWRVIERRRAEQREDAAQSAALRDGQMARVIDEWQKLAAASRERADNFEARLREVEAEQEAERKRHAEIEQKLRSQLAISERRASDAEHARDMALKQVEDMSVRLATLEAYVATHAQLSVAAIQRGLLRALAERAPDTQIDGIVAEVIANMKPES